MSDRSDKPYVPADTSMAELTFKALFLGVLMAIVLGAANAYIGMKAGLTVAATFPAAVVAMAALRGLGGTILEENIARTTASVGEALVAGAIFTIPAFVISGAWEEQAFLDDFEALGFENVTYADRSSTPWKVVEEIEFRAVTLVGVLPGGARSCC